MIVTAEHEYQVPPWAEIPLVLRAAALYPRAAQRVPPAVPPRELHPAAEVVAYVNHGRWVADCLTSGCGGALVVSPEDPRFYCPYCFNVGADEKLVKVVFPSKTARAAVEAELLKRVLPLTMNFDPRAGETLAAIRVENRERGLR